MDNEFSALTKHLVGLLAERRICQTDLEMPLEIGLSKARKKWPAITVSPDTFASFLASLVKENKDIIRTLSRLRLEDLYLTCACLQSNSQAVKSLLQHCDLELKTVIKKVGIPESQHEEYRQHLFMKLLTGDKPKLAQYGGRCEIKSWMWVTSTRMALNFKRDFRQDETLSGEVLDRLKIPCDQELSYLKKLYRKEFKNAFFQALFSLESKERNILRYSVVEGHSIDKIALLYGKSRATAARMLQKIRQKLKSNVKTNLKKLLHVNSNEYQSIVAIVISQFDVSLHRILSKSVAADRVTRQ